MDENRTSFPKLKIVEADFEVDFEVEISELCIDNNLDEKYLQNDVDGLAEINSLLDTNKEKISELDKELDRLTNHADGFDYAIAVASGILAGFIDSFWVGDFDFSRGRKVADDKVNNFIVKTAKSQGFEGEDLSGAIKHLENKFKLASDSNTPDFGGGLQHHLRDFAHHPTLVGLSFSLLTQFTEKAYGTDRSGAFKIVEVANKSRIGNDLPQKILLGTVHWFFHLVSDMAGSSSYAGMGTGLPGPLLSFAKEISALPIFKNSISEENTFSLWISKLFNGTLLGERDEYGKLTKPVRFDLRAELGVLNELGRQAVPVIINECIVRGMYFVRRLYNEIKEKDIQKIVDLERIEWKKVLPFKNRTIIRMLTISSATFTIIDLADAAVRSGLKSAGSPGVFAKEFIMKVNFVGVGRVFVAVSTDAYMGIKRSSLRNQRINLYNEQLHLMNAKVFYLQADTWKAAETSQKTIAEAMDLMEETTVLMMNTWKSNAMSLEKIGEYREGIEDNNEGLIEDLLNTLKWG